MRLLYTIGIYITGLILKVLSVVNTKLKQGVIGRNESISKLELSIKDTDKTFWFHCASLGEYEQGLPVFEILRAKYPDYKVVLSFFSPSGYEVRKNTKIADVVVYLPLDTPVNAKHFLNAVHPEYIIFVKYEIWPNFLLEIKKRQYNAILISAVFRENQSFFKWYGKFMRAALFGFNHIFTQDNTSKKLLEGINYTDVSVSGDTRFDRVSNQLLVNNNVPFIEKFKNNRLCIVFGSTWPEDDKLYIDFINNSTHLNLKYIIAPHNISTSYTSSLKTKIKLNSICYSDMADKNLSEFNVFILDTIGYLSKVYSYADIAYVGGGAGNTGLHNILEPAVFGTPIIIGKNYDKFPEAKALINAGGVMSVTSSAEFALVTNDIIKDASHRASLGEINRLFIKKNKGSVIQIVNYMRI